MAFLGGLMSGTSGAFLRGSMDAASSMIQASAQRDEDEIAEKVKGFGAKHKEYLSGVDAYSKETRKINDVASAISGDPSLKDRSPEEIQGLAQQLMTIDSANPVKYFLDNRDKLTISKMETPDVSAQTDEALATTLEETSPTVEEPASGFKAFAGRLLGGASENEQIQRAAKQLGITPDMYMRIMAGKIPTRPQPNVRITLGEDDPFEEVIKSNNTAVTAMFQSERYQNLTSVSVPDGKGGMVEIDSGDFAKQVLDAHLTYTQTGEGGAALASMQNFALTLAMPKEVSDAFSMYTKTFDKIAVALEDINTPEAVVTGLKLISDQLADHRQRAITTPGYGKNGTELEEVHNLVIGAQTFLRQVPNKENGEDFSPQGKLVKGLIDNLLQQIEKRGANDPIFKPDLVSTAYGLYEELNNARGDTSKLSALNSKIVNLFDTGFGDARGETPKDESAKNAVITTLKDLYPDYNETALSKMADRVIVFNPKGIFGEETGTGRKYFMVPSTPGGPMVKQYVDTLLSGGAITSQGYKIRAEDDKVIFDNVDDFNVMAGLYKTTSDNPLVFTAFGAMTVAGQTYADVAGVLTKSPLGQMYNEYFNVSDQAEARRKAISLVGSAKDRLFDDPRLSDQDLNLVLKYIAILGEDGKGIGTGSTRALAALHGLQVALMKDNAARMYRSYGYENSPSTVMPENYAGGGVLEAGDFYKATEDGKGVFNDDGSLASTLFQSIANGYEFDIKTSDEINALGVGTEARKQYDAELQFITQMTDAALHDVKTHYIYGKARNRQMPSSLLDMGEVDSDGTIQINDAGERGKVQSLESALEDAKRRRKNKGSA
tara:strand:- start:568 stop:3063 length:2496 start_codon:yes stop_codon:yes gene_type:complete